MNICRIPWKAVLIARVEILIEGPAVLVVILAVIVVSFFYEKRRMT